MDDIVVDRFADKIVGYRSFKTARGDLMLTISVDGEKRYELGPFETKEQRQALLNKLRAAINKFGAIHERVW